MLTSQFLRKLVDGRSVLVDLLRKDQYGRVRGLCRLRLIEQIVGGVYYRKLLPWPSAQRRLG